MLPVLFEIGGFKVTSFGVMVALGFIVSAWMAARELRRKGLDPEAAWDVAAYAAVGGILGAKLYYMILHLPETMADPTHALLARSGLVWYGGFLGGTAAVLWRLHRLKMPIMRFGDALAPALPLGYAVGRVGCFLVGDDYGSPTSVPWAVAFPQGAPPSTAANLRAFGENIPAGVPDSAVLAVHPTQLYETGISLVIFAVLWRLRDRFASTGSLFYCWMALAGVERFIVEIFRAKDDRFLGAFSVAQLISVGMIVFGVTAMAILQRRAAAQPQASPARPASA